MVSFTNRDMKVMVGIGAGWTIVVFAVFFARTGEMASLQAHSQEPLGPLNDQVALAPNTHSPADAMAHSSTAECLHIDPQLSGSPATDLQRSRAKGGAIVTRARSFYALLEGVFDERGWTMRPRRSREQVRASGRSVNDLDSDVALAWWDNFSTKYFTKFVGKMFIAYIEGIGMSGLGGMKSDQFAVKREYLRSKGCEVTFMPLSYDMSTAEDCRDFWKDWKANESARNALWLVKPDIHGGGRGISVVQGEASLKTALGALGECAGTKEQNGRTGVKGTDARVVQRYLVDQLLLQQRKFDIRHYMLIASTRPFLVFHRYGFLRRSIVLFNESSSSNATDDSSSASSALYRAQHIVNTVLQLKAGQDSLSDAQNAIWLMSDLQRYLSVTHNLPSDYVRSVLTPKLRSIARLVFDASKSRLVRHNGTFQMVGLDIMLDSHFNPHLIEANQNPAAQNFTAGQHKLHSDLYNDLFDLETELMLNPSDKLSQLREGESLFGWELVYNEKHALCGIDSFDPCQAQRDLLLP